MSRQASPAQLHLDNQLCFLFHRIARGLDAVYRPMLSKLGLTYPQYLVMLVLWEGDGITVGELGRRLCLDSGTLSPLVRRLETSGLVERTRDRADERRVSVRLTAEGAALRDRAQDIPGALSGTLVDDAGEYTALHEQLTELVQKLES